MKTVIAVLYSTENGYDISLQANLKSIVNNMFSNPYTVCIGGRCSADRKAEHVGQLPRASQFRGSHAFRRVNFN